MDRMVTFIYTDERSLNMQASEDKCYGEIRGGRNNVMETLQDKFEEDTRGMIE